MWSCWFASKQSWCGNFSCLTLLCALWWSTFCKTFGCGGKGCFVARNRSDRWWGCRSAPAVWFYENKENIRKILSCTENMRLVLSISYYVIRSSVISAEPILRHLLFDWQLPTRWTTERLKILQLILEYCLEKFYTSTNTLWKAENSGVSPQVRLLVRHGFFRQLAL